MPAWLCAKLPAAGPGAPGFGRTAMARFEFPDGVAYVEGRFCPMSEARIPVLDGGFLRSDATCDAVHVWRGRVRRRGSGGFGLDDLHGPMALCRLGAAAAG